MSPRRTDPSASHSARSRPAPPSRRAPPRPDPPVVCPGFGLDRLGLHRTSFVRASEGSPTTFFFGALEVEHDWSCSGRTAAASVLPRRAPPSPAPPPLPAPPCHVPSAPPAGCLRFPGYALRVKGLQRQIGVGTSVSSQERRALLVPWLNRWSTVVFVLLSVYIGFPLPVLLKKRSAQLFSMPRRARGSVVSWANRSVGVPSCPAQPRPAALPCAAPTRPARGMSGFWIRQVGFDKPMYIGFNSLLLLKARPRRLLYVLEVEN